MADPRPSNQNEEWPPKFILDMFTAETGGINRFRSVVEKLYLANATNLSFFDGGAVWSPTGRVSLGVDTTVRSEVVSPPGTTGATGVGRAAFDKSKSRYVQMAIATAEKYGIPKELFLALIKHESGWNPLAKSPAGAVGLTQLMPGTAAGLGIRSGELTNPALNLDGGARYLKIQLDRFSGKASPDAVNIKRIATGLANDTTIRSIYGPLAIHHTMFAVLSWGLALAAYNAGPGRVKDDIPNIRATLEYVRRVVRSALIGDI